MAILRQFLVMLENVLATDGVEVVHRRVERDGCGDVRRARLELVRNGVPGAVVVVHGGDHLAPALIRRRGFEDFLAPVEHAAARGPAHLVAAEREEIAPHRLHVHHQMPRALRPVHQRGDAKLPRPGAEFGHGVDGPESIRDMHHREQFHVAREELVEAREVESVVIGADGQEAQLRPRARRQQMPRHDVAVMLHLGEQDHIARLDELAAPRLRHEVDALRGAACEHNLVRVLGIDELRHPRARRLEGVGRTVAQLVDAAVDVRIVPLVIAHQRLNHRPRLLRRGGVVQVNERMPVDALVEDGKVAAQRGPVWSRGRHKPLMNTKRHE